MQLELFQIIGAFESFSNLKKNNEIPFKLAWEISDILEPLKKHVERFNEEKNKLVKEYGQPDKDKPEMYTINPEKARLFTDKLNEIGKTKVEIKNPLKIEKKKLLENNLKINGNIDLDALKLFIIDK